MPKCTAEASTDEVAVDGIPIPAQGAAISVSRWTMISLLRTDEAATDTFFGQHECRVGTFFGQHECRGWAQNT